MDSVFDRALGEIGQDGKFQKKFDFIYNVILAVLWPMAYMNLILALVIVPHTCQLPDKPDGIDDLSWKKMNIPTRFVSAFLVKGQTEVVDVLMALIQRDKIRKLFLFNYVQIQEKYTNAVGEERFDSCRMYTSIGGINNNTKDFILFYATIEDLKSVHCVINVKYPHDFISCHLNECEKYEYDKTWYDTTVSTENNWVCDKELYVANIFASSKIGELVGSIIFGWFGDTYGRRPGYILSLLLMILGRIISLLSGTSFIIFVIGCVVASFPSWSVLQSVNVISMEISSPDRRTLTATLRFAGWSVGMAIMSLLYWWLRDWKIFFIATTATQLPFLLFSGTMIESPRWLWIQGNTEKCVRYLKTIAKQNKKYLSVETEKEILNTKAIKKDDSLGTLALFSGMTIAKNTILQLIIWVCITLSYSVVMMSSGEKTDGNPYLELAWQSLAEIPGYFLAAYLADRIGRRYTGGASFSIIAATWLFLVFRESSSNNIIRHSWVGSAVVIVNRLFTTMAYSIVNIFGMELYPTCIRQSGMALGNLFSSGGSALAPYVLYLGRRVDSRLTGATLTCVCIIGVICNLLLPETLNKKLPETIEDAQVFGKTKRKYIPVSQKNCAENHVITP